MSDAIHISLIKGNELFKFNHTSYVLYTAAKA